MLNDDHLAHNAALWAMVNEQHTDAQAQRLWARDEFIWGLFEIPERVLGALGDVRDRDVVELGCGTAYVSAWLARMGSRPVAVDLTAAQLATAQTCQRQHGLAFPLIQADAEAVPLRSASFDLAISEYGASLWCDPDRWISEAARLLRPGGRLVFLTNSPLVTMCVPDDEGHAVETLQRGQRDIRRVQWAGGGIEHHPSHSELIKTLRRNGFEVLALHELFAPPGAAAPDYYDIATPDWAARWPVEDLWVAQLSG